MTIEEFAKKAISVPFKPHGRSWDNWDCWGLVYMAYKEVLGIELPRYDNDYKSIKDKVLLQKLFLQGIEDNWKAVDKPQACDGIMYFASGRTCHVGIAVDNKMMLHTEHGTGTTYERINNFRRIEGIYRYVGK